MDSSIDANRNRNEHWTPRDFNQIKVNIDGALFAGERRYDIGLVARSSDGAIIQTTNMNKALLADVSSVSFHFVKRYANKVVHVLARSSLVEVDRTFSSVTLPTVIASLILEDLN
uniref:RNase H type-1 domain-containing protein n=1 Tax=Cannabis sativa TaxID=3483 RepID=A0A803NR59_CANSA